MKKNNQIKNQERLKFIEAFVYIILIIITIIASIYGSIYIKLIPLLFFLGIIGKVVFGRPVLTSFFGGVFSIIVMHINGTYTMREILIFGLTNTVLIFIGEIFGICLITCYNSINNKNITSSEKIKNYVISLLFFILCIYMTFYMNGNLIRYKQSEYKLIEYLRNNYENLTFEVSGYRYVPYVNRGYIFKAKNMRNENTYKFIVYEKNTLEIYDEFKINTIKMKNNDINKFIADNINIENFNVNCEYIKYNKVNINIIATVSNDDFYEEVASKLEELLLSVNLYKNANEINDINIIVKNNEFILSTASFYLQEYIKEMSKSNEKNYIINMLKIEFFDF